MIASICTDSNWVPNRFSSAVLPLQQSVQLHTVFVRKIVRQMQCAQQHKLQQIHSHKHTLCPQTSNTIIDTVSH
jgi:hypothetical protein